MPSNYSNNNYNTTTTTWILNAGCLLLTVAYLADKLTYFCPAKGRKKTRGCHNTQSTRDHAWRTHDHPDTDTV